MRLLARQGCLRRRVNLLPSRRPRPRLCRRYLRAPRHRRRRGDHLVAARPAISRARWSAARRSRARCRARRQSAISMPVTGSLSRPARVHPAPGGRGLHLRAVIVLTTTGRPGRVPRAVLSSAGTEDSCRRMREVNEDGAMIGPSLKLVLLEEVREGDPGPTGRKRMPASRGRWCSLMPGSEGLASVFCNWDTVLSSRGWDL